MRAHQDPRHPCSKMCDFRYPFLGHACESGWTGEREADDEEIGIWIAERAEPVMAFFARSIEEGEGLGFAFASGD